MTLRDQQVLITGATGFLGGALARRLVAEGARVRVVARSPQKAEGLRSLGVEVLPAAMADVDALRAAAGSCAYVFHSAASFGRYDEQVAVNVEGTRVIARAAAEAGAQRFIHVSSIAVYGFCYPGDVREAMPPAPGADAYALTKAQGERAVWEVAAQTGLPYTIIRPGMIYGPKSVPWTEGLFKLARRNPTPFVSEGHGSSHPIFIDDVVDLMTVMATHPAAVGEVFNCSPDPAPTWREFLGAYARLAGHSNWRALPRLPLRMLAALAMAFSPRYTALRELPDLLDYIDRRFSFKMDKARELLGWSPQVPLNEGIERCAPWLRERGLLS